MKLVRFGPAGQEKPGILGDDGVVRDVSSIVTDFTPDNLSDAALDKLRNADLASLPAAKPDRRCGACPARHRKGCPA